MVIEFISNYFGSQHAQYEKLYPLTSQRVLYIFGTYAQVDHHKEFCIFFPLFSTSKIGQKKKKFLFNCLNITFLYRV